MIASPAPISIRPVEAEREVVGVVELVADGLLGLAHVRRDHGGLGAQRRAHRLAVGVEDADHAEALELPDQPRVDAGVDARREAAGEHADARALRQVEELLDEAVDLLGAAPRGRAR